MLECHHISRRLAMLTTCVWAFGQPDSAARAQVGAIYDHSLEAMVAEADTVVRGTISGFKRLVIIPKNGRLPDGTTLPDGRVEYHLSLRVEEPLRGTTPTAFALVRETSAYDRRVDQWLGEQTEFLWFFKQADAEPDERDGVRLRSWRSLRLGPPVQAERSYKTFAPPIFSMDFRVLRQRDEILKAARSAAEVFQRSKFQPVRTATVIIPHGVAHKCNSTGDVNFFVVPVVESLEGIARRMIVAPAELGDGFSEDELYPPRLRHSGVELLAHFKSDENAALLKTLLDDPYFVLYRHDDDGEPLKNTERRYEIRRQAFDTLRQWGVDVPKPVLREVHSNNARP